jgi:hypothetical protein
MRLIPRIAAAMLTTTIVVGGTTTAGHAQSTTLKDKSSDVINYASMKDEVGVVLGYAESVASGVDLRSMRVKHTAKSVKVDIRLSHLKNDTTVFVSFRLDGSKKDSHFLYNTWEDRGQVVNARGQRKCKVPLTTKTGKNGSVSAVIKRSCLGDPKKLQASAGAMSPGAFETDVPILADPLSPSAVRTPTYTKWLKAG